MAPHQHLDWFEDNIAWFEELALDELPQPVPNCPGWTVEDVLNHLSFGLGLAYPVASSKPPATPDEEAFDGVEWPDVYPVGSAAKQAFSANLRACLAAFRSADPQRGAWTYGGPGVVGFWFRRAAIETALHRLDVEEVLSRQASPIPPERIVDGIAETIEFALPLAATMAGEPDGGVVVAVTDLAVERTLGRAPTAATISGTGRDVFGALWGRHRDRVEIVGDHDVAAAWLSRVDLAFAGR